MQRDFRSGKQNADQAPAFLYSLRLILLQLSTRALSDAIASHLDFLKPASGEVPDLGGKKPNAECTDFHLTHS